jgi:hypothetical protein
MNFTALFPAWLTHIPFGWIVVVILLLILTVDAMRSGAAHVAILAIAAPIALFFFSLIPHTFLVGGAITPLLAIPYVMAGIFVVLFIAAFLLSNRMTATFGGSSGGLLNSLLAGMSGTIVLLVMWVQVPVLLALWNPGDQIHAVFGLPYALIWFLGVYLVLAFVRS